MDYVSLNPAEEMNRKNMASMSDGSYYHIRFHDFTRFNIL